MKRLFLSVALLPAPLFAAARDRRYPLVDEAMGVVLAAGFMDHATDFR